MECRVFVNSCFTHGKLYLSTNCLWRLSLGWQNFVKMPILPIFSRCENFYESYVLVYLSKVLIYLKLAFILWNKSAWQLSSVCWQCQNTPNKCNLKIIYCIFIAQNLLIPPKYHEQNWKLHIAVCVAIILCTNGNINYGFCICQALCNYSA